MFLDRVVKPSLKANIEKERFHLFMLEIIPHFIGGLITAAVLYYVFDSQVDAQDTLIWFSTMGVVTAIITVMYLFYFFAPDKCTYSQWRVVIFGTTALFAAFLAMAPHILLKQNDNQYITALLIIVIAMALAPVSVMANYIESFYIYITIPLISMFVKILITDANLVLMTLILAFWIMGIIASWRIFRINIEGIQYKLEVNQAKQEAEKANVEKSRFLAAASHDIRQPLQAIHLFITALQGKYELKQEPLMQRLESSVNNMSELLDSLLDISKLDAGAIHPVEKDISFRETLRESIQTHTALAHEKGIQLNDNYVDRVLYSDPILLNRVISNLLSNAVKYTDSGKIDINLQLIGDKVQVSITDTGTGIPLDKQQDIYQEFVQLASTGANQPQGLGLGLSIVSRLCQLQDWSLTLSSVEGEGSRFELLIPIGNANAIVTEAPVASQLPAFEGKRVLILDDEESIIESLSALLGSWQCDVRCFQSSQDLFDQFPNADWQPELIISDYRLNEEITGVDVVNQLRAMLGDEIPTVVITGDTAAEKIQEVQSSGIPVLYKPVRAPQLRMVMQKLLINKS